MSLRSILVIAVVTAGCGGHDANNDHVTDAAGGTTDGQADAPSACAGVLPAMKAVPLVTSGLSVPVFVAQPPGSTDLYVAQRSGALAIVRNGSVLATPFLTVSDVQFMPAGEGGLLSVAFHPQYATNGRFFVYVTVTSGDTVVREYQRSSNPDVAVATPVATLLTQPNSGGGNVGGTVLWGPDGMLWVGTGDGGNPPDAADLTSRRGKILRVDPDHPGTAPANNLGGAADPYVWDYGLRNPFHMSFDRETHELYVGDAGNDKLEEVDIEPMATGHRNYGWPIVEGNVCADGTTTCSMAGVTLPQYTRPHQVDYSVLIGGIVYRGAALPCLRGHYVFLIFGTQNHILTWTWNGTTVSAEQDLTATFNVDHDIVSINEDQAGELYLTTLGGKVYQIVPM